MHIAHTTGDKGYSILELLELFGVRDLLLGDLGCCLNSLLGLAQNLFSRDLLGRRGLILDLQRGGSSMACKQPQCAELARWAVTFATRGMRPDMAAVSVGLLLGLFTAYYSS